MKLSFILKAGAVTALLLLAAYVTAVANYTLPAYETGAPPRPDPYGLFHYRGAIHVHTAHSPDAEGSVSDAVVAARNNELDFLVITDHNTLAAKKEEGYKDGLVLLVGAEISTDHGHFISLGLNDDLSEGDRRGADYFHAASLRGGFNVVAHPFAGNHAFHRLQAGGYDGIEIMNLKEMFEEAARFPYVSLSLAAVAWPVSPRYALYLLYRRPDEAIAFLDRTLHERPVTILCGADAHGTPDSTLLLGQCVNHILTAEKMNGRFDHDAAVVMDAVRNGRVFVAADGIARADGFAFECGRTGSSRDRRVRMSLKGFARPDLVGAAIFWNGQKVGGRDGLREEWTAPVPGTGPVRIEVSLVVPTLLRFSGTVPWIHAIACQD